MIQCHGKPLPLSQSVGIKRVCMDPTQVPGKMYNNIISADVMSH